MSEQTKTIRERIDDGEFNAEPSDRFKTAEEAQLELDAFAVKEEIDNAKRRLTDIQTRQRQAKQRSNQAWWRHKEEKQAAFKQAALAEAGIAGHPKADKMWDMAWERGHGAGYHEVLSELEQLSELMQ